MNCFFVTALRKEDTRTFGFYTNLAGALTAVDKNDGDMEECYYDYIVIESIESDKIHPRVVNRLWFRWDNGWNPCDHPREYYGISNFALG